jgi:hypothetical protein
VKIIVILIDITQVFQKNFLYNREFISMRRLQITIEVMK